MTSPTLPQLTDGELFSKGGKDPFVSVGEAPVTNAWGYRKTPGCFSRFAFQNLPMGGGGLEFVIVKDC